MRDRYDVTVDRYTSTGTNGVETVKKFEEVKGEIEKELRQIAAVLFYETYLIDRAYAAPAAKGASRLDEMRRVVVHGVLHLCGQKDKTPRAERQMHRKEDKYLAFWKR